MTWLTLIGIGAEGVAGLGDRARRALAAAEILVGSDRHHALVPGDSWQRLRWRSPLSETVPELLALRPRQVAVLATGDPLWYGVGRLLLHHMPAAEVTVLPHVSAFQEACSRLGWAIEDVHHLTVHGRSIATLRRYLQPGRRLLVLTSDGTTPAAIGRCLADAGYGQSRTVVLERLGAIDERVIIGTIDRLGADRFADLNVLAIELIAEEGCRALSNVPGLPDDAYDHDGQLTKSEVRALTLAALAPRDGELLWDVGAGAGSVAIEWLRSGRRMGAVAIERDPVRAARITANAEQLGVPELVVRVGEAPDALSGLSAPSAIFVGGGTATPGLLDHCWSRLQGGGRLIANAVTVAGDATILAFQATHGGRLLRLALTRAEHKAGRLLWRPAMPLTHLTARK